MGLVQQGASERGNRNTRKTESKPKATSKPSVTPQTDEGKKGAEGQKKAVAEVLWNNLPVGGVAGGVRSHRAPDPGGERRSGIAADGPTRASEAEDRAMRNSLRTILLQHLSDQEKQDRRDALERERMASSERIAALNRGPRVYKFRATMNGSGGVHYQVKYKDIGKDGGAGGYGGSSGDGYFGSPGSSRGPSEFKQTIAALLDRLDGNTRGDPGGGAARGAKRQPRRRDYDWLPKDTEKAGSRKAYLREDFLGADDRSRSGRFQGGYMSPEFAEQWMDDWMDDHGGLRPGDRGWERLRRQAESAWKYTKQHYDMRFRHYGRTVMRDWEDANQPGAPAPGGAEATAAQTVGDQKGRDAQAAAVSMSTPVHTVPPTDGSVVNFRPPETRGETDLQRPNEGPEKRKETK